MICKKCQNKMVRNGKDVKNNQRFLCKHCGTTAYADNHRSRILTEEQKRLITTLSLQSKTIRSIAFAVGCSHTTVQRYLKAS